MTSPFPRFTLQVWQNADPATVAQFAVDCGIDGVIWKAVDGLNRMLSLQQVVEINNIMHDSGVHFGVWTNPRGAFDIYQQAKISAEAFECCDFGFLDVEPYPLFWGANNPPGHALQFASELLRNTNRPVCIQPDPRPARLAEIRIDEWTQAGVIGFSGQHYWTDFQQDHQFVVAQAILELGKHGEFSMPTLPGDAALDQLHWAGEALARSGAHGLVFWRYASPQEIGVQAGWTFEECRAAIDGFNVDLGPTAPPIEVTGPPAITVGPDDQRRVKLALQEIINNATSTPRGRVIREKALEINSTLMLPDWTAWGDS